MALITERVIAMLVRKDIWFLVSPGRVLFCQVAVTVVSLSGCVVIMNSIFQERLEKQITNPLCLVADFSKPEVINMWGFGHKCFNVKTTWKVICSFMCRTI